MVCSTEIVSRASPFVVLTIGIVRTKLIIGVFSTEIVSRASPFMVLSTGIVNTKLVFGVFSTEIVSRESPFDVAVDRNCENQINFCFFFD